MHLTSFQKAEICHRYKSGESSVRLAKAFGVRQPKIKEVLIGHGVTFKLHMNEAQKAKICELYQEGETSSEIAEKFGLLRHAVLLILKKNGIVPRTHSESLANRFTKYQCDTSFFDSIDTEEKAYWLGFIVADGNVYKNLFSVGLSAKDEEHLFRLRRSLGSTHPIKRKVSKESYSEIIGYVRETEVSTFRINSPLLVSALNRLGVVDNKSLTVQWPSIPNELERHFLRGLIDGDGCFYRSDSKPSATRFSLTGSESIIKAAAQLLSKECDLRPRKLIHKRGFCIVSVGGNNQISRIARYLYEDATIFLPRKYNKVKDLI